MIPKTKILNKKSEFLSGMKDAIPIGLGYFAVAFTLGIAAKNAGLSPFQGFIASALNNASAGEYAGFLLIAAGGTYIEMMIVILIANARYILMSFVMSQKLPADLPWYHKIFIGFDLTDELFALAIARKDKLNPFYFYGGMLMSMPFWATGTLIGVIAGQILPDNIVSALSVALYGMFIAIIVPPAKKDKILVGVIIISFALSYLFSVLPWISDISNGTRIIILTIIISTIFALLFPIKTDDSIVKEADTEFIDNNDSISKDCNAQNFVNKHLVDGDNSLEDFSDSVKNIDGEDR